jgi:leishmanolysin-like peptidase
MRLTLVASLTTTIAFGASGPAAGSTIAGTIIHCRDAELGPEQVVRAPQRYSHLRRQLSVPANEDWKPLRLHFEARELNASSWQRDYLLQRLLPATAAWLGQALRVVPAAPPLLAARRCISTITSPPHLAGLCGASEPAQCGGDAVPEVLLDELLVIANLTHNATLPSGAGAAADFALLVDSRESALCSGATPTLAFAATCQRDQQDRPILGYVNFCPALLAATPAQEAAEWESQLQATRGCASPPHDACMRHRGASHRVAPIAHRRVTPRHTGSRPLPGRRLPRTRCCTPSASRRARGRSSGTPT